ncbi:MAG: alpha/beta hydrolase, partial [Acidimicrobiales bacterium]|nr:alpha/beta hydrolase [Acidimicrobiales bacterium]
DLGGRVVPVPTTLSPEARQSIIDAHNRPAPPPGPLSARRDELDAQMLALNDIVGRVFPTEITEVTIDGVRCHLVAPAGGADPGAVLVNLHAGGFVTGSGSLVEAIPMAALTGATVIAVDYRLAPEHAHPAAVEDVLAVYRKVLEHHAADDVVLYGTSAGAFLTAQAVMRFRQEGLPLPVCCGMFSGGGDLTDLGDSAAIFTFGGFAGAPVGSFRTEGSDTGSYLRGADPDDPVVSPVRGDLAGFPPTLLVSSTRDAVLSSTCLMHRALRRAGVPAELYVFEALPHGFWFNVGLPETREALDVMAGFFRTHLGIDG